MGIVPAMPFFVTCDQRLHGVVFLSLQTPTSHYVSSVLQRLHNITEEEDSDNSAYQTAAERSFTTPPEERAHRSVRDPCDGLRKGGDAVPSTTFSGSGIARRSRPEQGDSRGISYEPLTYTPSQGRSPRLPSVPSGSPAVSRLRDPFAPRGWHHRRSRRSARLGAKLQRISGDAGRRPASSSPRVTGPKLRQTIKL